MEPWRAYRLMFADSHHFNEEQDLDPDPHLKRLSHEIDFNNADEN
jgi:hypothetical protein